AILATALAIRNLWRTRFRVAATLTYRSDLDLGNEVLITNLGHTPVTLHYWEILFLTRRWPRHRQARLPISPEDEILSRRLPPGDTCRLIFQGSHHFDLSAQRVYIKLHFAGRRPTLRLISGPRDRSL
ncbi:MAG: hypothetical protein OXQ28_07490, partial [Acidobacteriota bacterium]|nr:hypothetical protein [Acidobacteriota bacterium]